ncbi:hypothetical protein ACF0H5_020393 [Mactra antiquata]
MLATKLTDNTMVLLQEVDFDCKKRSSLKVKHNGELAKFQKFSSPELACSYARATDQYPIVTIETTDHFVLTADSLSLHVSLKKASDLNENNVFRLIDFGPAVEGHGRLHVFQLNSNPMYYLATTNLRHLELQSYCDDTLDPDIPDERFFRCFHSHLGVELLQPYAHKGYYIHHIDDFINVRKLELNYRPPEEFYMNFEIHKEQEIQRFKDINKASQNTMTSHNDVTSCATSTNQSESSTLTRTVVPDISKSSLKRKDSKKAKNKIKESPVTPKNGMLSCFGLGSLRKKIDKTKR